MVSVLPSLGTLGKLLNLSVPRFPHLKDGDFFFFLNELCEVIHVKT